MAENHNGHETAHHDYSLDGNTTGGDPAAKYVGEGLYTISCIDNKGSNILLIKVVDKNSASVISNKSVSKSHHSVHKDGERNSIGKAETVEGSIVLLVSREGKTIHKDVDG